MYNIQIITYYKKNLSSLGLALGLGNAFYT